MAEEPQKDKGAEHVVPELPLLPSFSNRSAQYAGVHECELSPCKPGSTPDEVSRSCAKCGKTRQGLFTFAACPGCFQLSYCVCLFPALHRKRVAN
jgi:hypothetical protein